MFQYSELFTRRTGSVYSGTLLLQAGFKHRLSDFLQEATEAVEGREGIPFSLLLRIHSQGNLRREGETHEGESPAAPGKPESSVSSHRSRQCYESSKNRFPRTQQKSSALLPPQHRMGN